MLQGTVKSFDPETGATVVLTDARVEYEVPPEAFRRSGLLRLTLGQRVKFRVEGEGQDARVTYVNILTLPDPA
jgi:cold shock CspA family protein